MERIGGYEITGQLGRGGMGVVYEARHPQLDRRVAIKVLVMDRQSDIRQQRFQTEARAVAQLRHPNVVAIHELGVDQGRPFFVMDLVEGEALEARLEREGALAPELAGQVALELARALEHAHDHGILHRDVKPANVLLSVDGRALLADFGLARLVSEERERLTKTGQLLGTPAYMPPEQARGDAVRVDVRADVYGLGATLYAMLSGRPPFDGDTAVSVLNQVLNERPAPLRGSSAELDPTLEAICRKCLGKDPEQRYASAGELAAALEGWQAGEVVAGARAPRMLLVLCAMLVLVLGGVLLALRETGDPASDEQVGSTDPPAPTVDPVEEGRVSLEASLAALRAKDPEQALGALDVQKIGDPQLRPQVVAARSEATKLGLELARARKSKRVEQVLELLTALNSVPPEPQPQPELGKEVLDIVATSKDHRRAITTQEVLLMEGVAQADLQPTQKTLLTFFDYVARSRIWGVKTTDHRLFYRGVMALIRMQTNFLLPQLTSLDWLKPPPSPDPVETYLRLRLGVSAAFAMNAPQDSKSRRFELVERLDAFLQRDAGQADQIGRRNRAYALLDTARVPRIGLHKRRIEEAIALAPRNPVGYGTLAQWHVQAGQLDEAIRQAEQALKVFDAEGYDTLHIADHLKVYLLGIVIKSSVFQGKKDEARELIRKQKPQLQSRLALALEDAVQLMESRRKRD